MTINFSQINLYNFQYFVVLSVGVRWRVVLAGKSTFHAHRVFPVERNNSPLTPIFKLKMDALDLILSR